MQEYKYFKDSEVINLDVGLVKMLDQARELAGIPFIITSGFRTPGENAMAGGVKDSAHLKGIAVDLRCSSSRERFLILKGLFSVGFPRIGIYKNHIHADIDVIKDLNVCWLEYKTLKYLL